MKLKDKKWLAIGILAIVLVVVIKVIAGVVIAFAWKVEDVIPKAFKEYAIWYLLCLAGAIWAIKTLMQKE